MSPQDVLGFQVPLLGPALPFWICTSFWVISCESQVVTKQYTSITAYCCDICSSPKCYLDWVLLVEKVTLICSFISSDGWFCRRCPAYFCKCVLYHCQYVRGQTDPSPVYSLPHERGSKGIVWVPLPTKWWLSVLLLEALWGSRFQLKQDLRNTDSGKTLQADSLIRHMLLYSPSHPHTIAEVSHSLHKGWFCYPRKKIASCLGSLPVPFGVMLWMFAVINSQ